MVSNDSKRLLMYFLCIACLVSGTDDINGLICMKKDGCVVKKASHGIGLGSWERNVCCRIDHGACWIGWFGGVHARMLYHVYMRGIDGLMKPLVL